MSDDKDELQQPLPKKRGRPRKNTEIKPDGSGYDISRGYYDKTPSVLIQSAFFGISEKREEVRNHKIPSIGDVEIKFTGELFNQFDFDVFQAIIELAHNKEQLIFNFKDSEVLKIMGKKYGTSTIESVRASLHRLKTAYFDIKTSKKSYFVGSLFSFYEFDKVNTINQIEITSKTLDMFVYASTYDKDIRNKLKGNLSKFYYMFFCSHSGIIYDYNLETFHELTDSEAKLKEFKRMTQSSFKKIFEITDYEPVLIKSKGGKDKVHVKKRGLLLPAQDE